MNYREIALTILMEVMEEGKYSHIVINQRLNQYAELSKQDRALISRLCLGTIENCIAIDYEIERYSKVTIKKMKPVIRNLLRISVYQMCYLSSMPDFAICNEAVKLTKKRNLHGLTGFVNGVLRTIARNKEEYLRLPEAMDEIKKVSIKYSMPEWILEEWYGRFPEDTVISMLEESQKAKRTAIRVNESKISKKELMDILVAEKVFVTEASLSNDVLYLADYDSIDRLDSFRKGYYVVQDISSVLAGKATAPGGGEYVIDLCAAPGGKALHIADMMLQSGKEGMVSARDLLPGKVKLMEENIKRCGFENIEVMVSDALLLREEDIGKADIVIADLPCSGLGIIGRKPDIKYKMTPDTQKELAKLQRNLLMIASRYVKRGGILIFSTCTIHIGENENNYKFIIDELGFEPESLNPYMPEELHSDTTEQGYLQILPCRSDLDGFFISRAKKQQ